MGAGRGNCERKKKGKSQKYVHKIFANIRVIKLKTNGRARGAKKKKKMVRKEKEKKMSLHRMTKV